MTTKKLRPGEQPSKAAPEMGELEAVLALVAATMERSPLFERVVAPPVLDDATALELLGRLRRSKSHCAPAPTVEDLERARSVLRGVALELLIGHDAGLARMADASVGIDTRAGCWRAVEAAGRLGVESWADAHVAWLVAELARPAVARLAELDGHSAARDALEADIFAAKLEALLCSAGAESKIVAWLTARTVDAVRMERSRARRGVTST